MKYLFSIICMLLISVAAIAQKGTRTSPSGNKQVLSAVVDRISHNSNYESRHVGFAGSYSEQYKNYDTLLASSTVPDLLFLVKHQSPAVRVYSFKALLAKNPRLASSIYESLKSDHMEIFTLEGCIGGQATVGSLAGQFMQQAGTSE